MRSGLSTWSEPGHRRCIRTLSVSSSDKGPPVTEDPADQGSLRQLWQFRSYGRPELIGGE
jgi:hypothetical protein